MLLLAAISLGATHRSLAGGHGHSPHRHSPHGHAPHDHSPHTHVPHTHTPHGHSPAPPSPPPSPNPPPSPTPRPPPPSPAPNDPPATFESDPQRFRFADGVDGLWRSSRIYEDVQCAIGGYVYFWWAAQNHDLWRMASKAHLDTCDFTGATPLVNVGDAAGATSTAVYYLPCTNAGEAIHLSCSVGTHCLSGQKMTVNVHPTIAVFDRGSGATVVHSRSLTRVYSLLGRRYNAATGFTHLDRGWQTEAAANSTLEMIWCLEDHCPESARDADADATDASCRAEVYNLAGFVSRKRPNPQYEHSESYYFGALELEPSHCATLEYLSELYVMRGNVSAAVATAQRLCAVCGASSATARQAEAAFSASGAVLWPCTTAAALSSSDAAPTARLFVVEQRLTIAGEASSFDVANFRATFAAHVAVDPALVEVTIVAGSVTLDVTVRTTDAGTYASLTQSLSSLASSPASASSALAVSVLAITLPTASCTLVTLAPPSPPSPPPPESSSGGGQGALAIAALVACVVTVGLLFVARAYRWHCRVASGVPSLPSDKGSQLPSAIKITGPNKADVEVASTLSTSTALEVHER